MTRTDANLSQKDALLQDGNYLYTGVVAGTYTITPKLAPIVSPSCLSFNPPSRIVDVTAADVSGQDFVATHPSPCYAIRGKVTASNNPDPNFGVSGDDIIIEDSNGNVLNVVTVSGFYEFQWLLPGTYTITPSTSCDPFPPCKTFNPASRTVTIVNSDVTDQNFVHQF